MDYINNACDGNDLSRYQLEEILKDNNSKKVLYEYLEKSTFKPFLFDKIQDNIKNGNLGPLGSFYPLDNIYITNNNKATGKILYDGLFNTDCGNIVGKNNNYQDQDIASIIVGFILFMGANNITSDILINGFKNFLLNPPDNYKIKLQDNTCSSFTFPGTGIGGKGEIIIYKYNTIVSKLQVHNSSSNIFDNLINTTNIEDIVKLLVGNVGMLWGLGFTESCKLNNNTNNLYYWGPSKLKEYGII